MVKVISSQYLDSAWLDRDVDGIVYDELPPVLPKGKLLTPLTVKAPVVPTKRVKGGRPMKSVTRKPIGD